MSVTDKFTKRITLVPGKSIQSAGQWAKALINRLDIADWGLPKAIISDRDRKFLSDIQKAIFQYLGVSLLYSTAYYPQTDGSSKRTNQTAEIALRFYIHALDKPEYWPEILLRLQALLNNSIVSTRKSANKVAYGFTLNRPLDLLALPGSEIGIDYTLSRISAVDIISFAQISVKYYYNRQHQPIFLKVGEYTLLRLYKGYSILNTLGVTKKLTQQYVGPFRVTKRVSRLAYCLAVPGDWKIHPVFTVAQLEPVPDPALDPFKRPRLDYLPSVFIKGDTDNSKSYEIERLLNKRILRKGRGFAIEYLVKWKGYGPEQDRWYNIKDLRDAQGLINDYKAEISQALTRPITPPSRPSILGTRRGRGRPRNVS